MKSQAPVAVIGAGIAGLVAAAQLRRNGRDVVVLEASPRAAGLAGGVDADGFHADLGAHFVTNRLARELGAESVCRTIDKYGETVWLSGRTARYPFGLLGTPRYISSAIRSRVGGGRGRPVTAQQWFRHAYGQALADEVALPLVEAWSGLPASELAASVGEKVPGSIAHTMWLTAAKRFSHKPVAIGYCGSRPESAKVWHVYPEKGGVAALLQPLISELGDTIRTGSPVEAVLVEDEKVRAVRAGGTEFEVSGAISTAPAPILRKVVQGTQTLEPLGQLRFRPMVFVNLRFRGRGLIPDVVVWTPESDAPYFRLTETPLATPWLAPEGLTQITADIGAAVGDAVWEASDDDLAELCLDHLTRIVPDARRRYLHAIVQRTPIAYPVFALEYEPVRRQLELGTGIEGLLSIGRNGEFAHLLMEDVYWRTRDKVSAEFLST